MEGEEGGGRGLGGGGGAGARWVEGGGTASISDAVCLCPQASHPGETARRLCASLREGRPPAQASLAVTETTNI